MIYTFHKNVKPNIDVIFSYFKMKTTNEHFFYLKKNTFSRKKYIHFVKFDKNINIS